MKKNYNVIVFLFLLFSSILSLFIAVTFQENHLLYGGTEKLIIKSGTDFLENQSLENKIEVLEQAAKESQLPLMKISRSSNDELTIYTNDDSLGGKIKYKKNQSAKSKSNHEGWFDWVDNRKAVRMMSLRELINIGVDGEYYFVRANSDMFHFKEELKNKTDLIVEEDSFNPLSEFQVLKAIFSNPALLTGSLVLLLSLIGCLLFLSVGESKKTAIQLFSGYSKLDATLNLLIPKVKIIFLLGVIFYFTVYLYMLLIFKSILSFPLFSLVYVTIILSVLLLLFIISSIWINIFYKNKQVYQIVNNKKNYSLLLILTKLFQLLFLVCFPFLLSMTFNNIQKFHSYVKSNENWNETKNVYRLSQQYITNDVLEKRPYEIKLKNFYLKEMDNLALLDVSNYDFLYSTGGPMYEANTHGKVDELTSVHGKSIVINPTYLSWHNVLDSDGKKIDKDDINRTENIFTILIPKNLKKYESLIKKSYTEYFLFQRAEVPKYYGEDGDTEVPRINIIYLREGQKYLTNDNEIKGDSNNLIVNPVVYVDTGQLDASEYSHWISSCIFFKGEKGLPGYETIQPLLIKNNVSDLIQLVTPIYNERAEEIQNTKETMILEIFLLVLLINSYLLCNYSFITALFDKNKAIIFNQIYHGFSFFEIVTRISYASVILDIFITIIACLFANISFFFATLVVTSLFLSDMLGILMISKNKWGDLQHDKIN